MLHKRNVVLWALINAAVLSSTAAAAVVYKDVSELAAAAQQVVVGDVVAVDCFWDDQHALIKSRIVVQVDQYLVGDGPGIEVLEMSGGTIDDLTLRVSVLPVFETGDHVLLFLNDNAIRLVESHQGAYLTDGTNAVRMGGACARAIPESLVPLATLTDQIQRALPSGATLPDIPPYQGTFQLPLERYSTCGFSWAYQANPMGENYVINANCADASAGDAASQRTQIQNGTAAWNNAGADFVFTYGGTSSQTTVLNNGVNLVYFDTTPPDGGGYIAATYIWASGGNISEVDLVFNDAEFTWWNGSGSCSGMMDIWNIATHEFGHWLCLADLYGGGDTAKTMYGYASNCQTNKRTLETDDINGIIGLYGAAQPPDTTAPAPNPMTFAAAPAPTSIWAVGMTATTATDTQSPPVQYYFNFVSGGTGATDSGWQSATSYYDSGLTPNTAYTYRVKARDSASTPNETAYSGNAATVTWIETPTGVSFGTVATDSIVLNATGTLTNLAVASSGVYFDSTTAGGDGGLNAWVQTTSATATGLAPNTLYTFQVKARNQNSVETVYCPTASKTTLANVPSAPTLSNVTTSTLNLNVNANGNPASTEFAIRCAATVDPAWNGRYVDATGNPSAAAVWRTDAAWGNILIQNLQPATQYCFDVRARNGEAVETAFSGQSCGVTATNVVPGDMNCDGSVGFADINPFVLYLSNFASWQATYVDCPPENGDINGDGTYPAFSDINPFVTLLSGG